MLDIRRREFITLLGGAAASPIAARAQAALPVIGILSGATFESMNAFLAWFYPGLESEGLTENRNFTTQFRWADDKYERLPALASDLVRRRVALIVALGTTPGAQAAKAATQTIPIVFIVGTDPVEIGLVPSLARPGGNLTGATNLVVELLAKNLSLMHELVPSAHERRWSHELRNEPGRYLPRGRRLCRPYPQRGEARRPSGAAGDYYKIDLAINLKVAKALGITVPTSIMLLATTVIE